MSGTTLRPETVLQRSSALQRILRGSWRTRRGNARVDAADVAEVCDLLLEGGSGPLAWRALDATEPTLMPSTEELRAAFRLSKLRAVQRERETLRTVEFFRSKGVEPLVVKGFAAARLYPDPALRPYGDVDVVVSPEDAPKAMLARAEYAPEIGSVDLHCRTSRKAELGRSLRQDGLSFCELDDFAWEDVVRRSVLVPAGGGSIRIPSPEDHLRTLCLHFLRHGGYRPLWLCDVAAAVESGSGSFDWSRFLAGDAWRTTWAVAVIRLAADLLDADITGTPAADIRLPAWIAESVRRAWVDTYLWPRGRPLIAEWIRQRHRPLGIVREIGRRWPGTLESSVRWRGPMNNFPRLPFQILELFEKAFDFRALLSNTGNVTSGTS